jgi:glycosyltransferase involved in cell wall biosynthesis
MGNKIAIITINYNDKIGLQKTIDSVLLQTYNEYEFIIIDGGSTDGSKKVIEENSSKISYWVSEPDKGIYNAMNKGIRAAKSEFVIFMNSGDIFHNSHVLDGAVRQLTDEYDIFYGNNYKVKENGYKRKKSYPLKLTFSFFYSSSLNHQSTFIRKSLFDTHFYYNENLNIAADWEFFIYTICKMNVPHKYLGFTISDYDYNGISSTESYRDVTNVERKTVIRKYFPLFEEDYLRVSELNSKRFNQIFRIQKYPIAWTLLKAHITVALLFLPKIRK